VQGPNRRSFVRSTAARSAESLADGHYSAAAAAFAFLLDKFAGLRAGEFASQLPAVVELAVFTGGLAADGEMLAGVAGVFGAVLPLLLFAGELPQAAEKETSPVRKIILSVFVVILVVLK
jgi:hypothetical protein